VGPIAQHQIAAHLDASRHQAVNLLQDAGRIEHHPAGDHALHLGAKDAAGNQRQFISLTASDHRMARVAAALITDDDLMLVGQQIDQLALGLVSPLQTNHARNRHRGTSLTKNLIEPKKRAETPAPKLTSLGLP